MLVFSVGLCLNIGKTQRVWETVFRYSADLSWTALQILPRSFFYTHTLKKQEFIFNLTTKRL